MERTDADVRRELGEEREKLADALVTLRKRSRQRPTSAARCARICRSRRSVRSGSASSPRAASAPRCAGSRAATELRRNREGVAQLRVQRRPVRVAARLASFTFQVTLPRNAAPVAFETPGPERRNPSVADRSSTAIANVPAERPLDGRNELAEPAIDALAFVAAGAGGGAGGGAGVVVVVTAPTVKLPRIWAECGSHWKKYVPSVSVTVNVLSPMPSTSVVTATPGPEKSKLWKLEWSWMTSVYVPASRCLTTAPDASFSEIENASPGRRRR